MRSRITEGGRVKLLSVESYIYKAPEILKLSLNRLKISLTLHYKLKYDLN